jgi:hypothetical protein
VGICSVGTDDDDDEEDDEEDEEDDDACRVRITDTITGLNKVAEAEGSDDDEYTVPILGTDPRNLLEYKDAMVTTELLWEEGMMI